MNGECRIACLYLHRLAGLAAHAFVLAGLAVGIVSPALAIPAYPGAVEVAQPDGATITLRLRGDEWLHWHEDAEGFAIVLERGEWRFATLGADGRLAPTPHTVGRSNPRSAGLAPGIRPIIKAVSITSYQGAATIGQ